MLPPVNSVNFKGKYIVQVPKSAFRKPLNAVKCEEEFHNAFARELYNHPSFNKQQRKNSLAFLEAPGYTNVVGLGPYNLSWYTSHTGVEIRPPKNPSFHSFVVLTKDEGKAFRGEMSAKKMRIVENLVDAEARQRTKKGLHTDAYWEVAMAYKYINEALKNCTKNSEEEVIVAQGLDNMKDVLDKMEF